MGTPKKPAKVTGIVSIGDPFAAIAKPSAPVSKTKSSKPTAEVTNEIRNAVDLLIAHKAEIKRLEAESTESEALIIDHVRPQQDDLAREGKFTKSLEVPGNTGALTYVTSDRFSVPNETDAIDSLKRLLGATFEDWFETKRTITLKKEAAEDQDFIQKLLKACEAAGMTIGDAFDVTDKLIAKPDLDQKQYGLSMKDLGIFRTLVRQSKPALK